MEEENAGQDNLHHGILFSRKMEEKLPFLCEGCFAVPGYQQNICITASHFSFPCVGMDLLLCGNKSHFSKKNMTLTPEKAVCIFLYKGFKGSGTCIDFNKILVC